MDLAKQAKIVDSIHDTLHDFVGQRLKVRANMGRSKIVESEGVLMQVHPQLFILEVDRKRGRTSRQSYQYVDVLTGMVELSQNGEPLFEPSCPSRPTVRPPRILWTSRKRRRSCPNGSGLVPANRRVSQARHPFCVSGLVSSVVQRGQRIE
ncbi:MAG: Veg family protein [Eggerthella lenta]